MAISFPGPFVHRIDPILGTLLGVHLWWYGLSYVLGFLNIHLFLWRRRERLGFSTRTVYDLTLLVTAGVLLGGRFVEVVFYEWEFYRAYPALVPAYWLGGMATHGLLLGAVAGIGVFCAAHRRPLLAVADVLAVPAAFVMGIGRIGNFIDGQIVGSVTSVPWAVRFPDAEGFRHPVVLYDGIKNLLLIPLLLAIARRRPPSGLLTGVFLFLYAFLRIFVDLFREYPTTLLGLATGQSLNIAMSAAGLVLIAWSLRALRWASGAPDAGGEGEVSAGGAGGDGGKRPPRGAARGTEDAPETAREAWTSPALWWRRVLLLLMLLFSLTIPSDWTQDVPALYGKRHRGLRHSALYPPVDAMRARAAGAGSAGAPLP